MNDQLNFKILQSLFDKFAEILPKLILFIVFVILGWLLLKLVLYVFKGVLKLTKIDRLKEKLNDNELIQKTNITVNPSRIILTFVKWFVILILIIVGAEFLELHAISEQTANLIGYLPQFLTAVFIFVIGIYFANFVKTSIQSILKSFDFNGSKIISLIVFYFLAILISITALNQAGVNTAIITQNLFLIIGAFFAAFTLAFGLGSKDIVYRLLLGFYQKKNIAIGSLIRVGDIEGYVLSIDNISAILKTQEGRVVLPIKSISNKKIEILD